MSIAGLNGLFSPYLMLCYVMLSEGSIYGVNFEAKWVLIDLSTNAIC